MLIFVCGNLMFLVVGGTERGVAVGFEGSVIGFMWIDVVCSKKWDCKVVIDSSMLIHSHLLIIVNVCIYFHFLYDTHISTEKNKII